MTGMKNYLLKHGEGEFIGVVKRERDRLKANQFLNIDSILECSLQRLVIAPLKNYIYDAHISWYNSTGTLKILSHNIKMAQTKSAKELGLKSELIKRLTPEVMASVQHHLRRMAQSYSPIKKLEHLLKVMAILGAQTSQSTLDDQDMVPILVYIIVNCGLISAEIEIEYMLGLLHPSILNGEASYYLTLFSSAVQVIKSMFAVEAERQLTDVIHVAGAKHQVATGSTHGNGPVFRHSTASTVSDNLRNLERYCASKTGDHGFPSSISCSPSSSMSSNMPGAMKILIPNELTSQITCKQVPVRANMTTKEVCRMLAHSGKITNPEDYGLYRIAENGLNDVLMMDGECPQAVRAGLIAQGQQGQVMFAYKRCDAKFIWPSCVG